MNNKVSGKLAIACVVMRGVIRALEPIDRQAAVVFYGISCTELQ